MKITGAQYCFGGFWFDAARCDLRLDGVPLPARSQALELLAALLARPGTLLSKDELLKAVWPDVHVEEANIAVQVHYLRRILQDAAKPHRWIATVPGRGYRFVGPLEAPPEPNSGVPHKPALSAAGLPTMRNPTIGRERELAALQAQMPRHRLVLMGKRCCQSNRYKSLISTRQAKLSAHPATCSRSAIATDLRSL